MHYLALARMWSKAVVNTPVHVKSSSRAQLSKLQATSCEEPIQKTVVSSAYIKVL